MSPLNSSSPTLLAIDTATEACSVCLLHNGQSFSLFEPTPRQHSQKILPMVEQVLADAGIAKKDIEVVAFGQGPGSFTGVRIAVSIAQGLAFGLGVPLIPVSDTQAMAESVFNSQPDQKNVMVTIDARMNEVYFASYQLNNGNIDLVSEEQVISPESIETHHLTSASAASASWTAVGTGWKFKERFPQALIELVGSSDENALPHAESIARLGFQTYLSCKEAGEFPSIEDCVPVYLRNDVAWKKIPQQK